MSEQQRRDRTLMRAFLIGAMGSRTYAWLWLSLWRYGGNWRWN